MLFPQPGIYLTGAFNISSNTTTVLGSVDSKDYPLIQPNRPKPRREKIKKIIYSGTEVAAIISNLIYQSLVHSWGASFIRITGSGIIDGQGSPWWNCWRHDRKASPCNGISRPHLINLIGGDNVQVSGKVLLEHSTSHLSRFLI